MLDDFKEEGMHSSDLIRLGFSISAVAGVPSARDPVLIGDSNEPGETA